MKYGLRTGARITYGAPGFPPWVYVLAARFNVRASTYPGHQESHRDEAGFAPNTGHLNRGIDWVGSVPDMQRFADYLMSARQSLEQLIWQNPETGARMGVAGGRDVSTSCYYSSDYGAHRDHVHTRQSEPIPIPPGGTVAGWTGDPLWLADVVEPAVAKFVEYPGWKQRGHGDFKDIRGIMVHHTGGRASAKSIAEGRPDLPGPLSQFHISQDGTVTVVAAGVAWHAGAGSYPWLPTNMGNWHLIGIECEGPVTPGIGPSTQDRERWPDAEIIALRNVCAAVLTKLRFGTDRIIGHKDYAGRSQGKWDPWNMSMDWFRGEVAKDMAGTVFPGEGTVLVTPPPVPAPTPPVDKYAGVLLHFGMTGAQVRVLQERLKRNYSLLVVDGVFGPHTQACVVDYQRRHPPLAADGVVGPATAASLKLVL